MHMTKYIVKPGQYVQAGQVIGYMGSTGGSTGVHLHFGISYNGVYIDPQSVIKFK
jgi:murein DD-endopeptidase MepM/ murein hydrolase activator NlpD